MADINDALLATQRWGRQAVIFAICIRAQDERRPIDEQKQAEQAARASEKVASELWGQAATDQTSNAQIPVKFARLVFEWVQDHLNSPG